MEVLTWDDHSWARPLIEAAISSGRPPASLLLGDYKRTWGEWDDKLVAALAFLNRYEVEGWPVWIEESPRIKFEAKKKTIRSRQAIEKMRWQDEKKRSGDKKGKGRQEKPPAFGVHYYVLPVTTDGGLWPRKAEWLEAQKEKTEATEKKLTDGSVVKTRSDPDKMAEYRAKRRGNASSND